MKKIIAILFILTFSGTTLLAQCGKLFDYNEGTTWEWTNYDKKGKEESKSIQKVLEMNSTSDGLVVSLSTTIIMEDGEEFPPMEMDMVCKDGVIYYDMHKFVPDQYLKDEENDTEIKIEGTNLEMPASMKAGDLLKDASVTMNIGGASTPIPINMSVDIINRKVESEESINTPAGNFDCFVITQTTRTKLMMTFSIDTKEWYTPGIGMVKSESYKKGKLTNYSVLTAYTK